MIFLRATCKDHMSSKNRRKPAATSSTFQRAMRTLTKTLAVASLFGRGAKANNNGTALRRLTNIKNPSVPALVNSSIRKQATVAPNNQMKHRIQYSGETFAFAATNKNRPKVPYSLKRNVNTLKHKVNLVNKNSANKKKLVAYHKNLNPHALAVSINAALMKDYNTTCEKELANIRRHFNKQYNEYRPELLRACKGASVCHSISLTLPGNKVPNTNVVFDFLQRYTSSGQIEKLNPEMQRVVSEWKGALKSLVDIKLDGVSKIQEELIEKANQRLQTNLTTIEDNKLSSLSNEDMTLLINSLNGSDVLVIESILKQAQHLNRNFVNAQVCSYLMMFANGSMAIKLLKMAIAYAITCGRQFAASRIIFSIILACWNYRKNKNSANNSNSANNNRGQAVPKKKTIRKKASVVLRKKKTPMASQASTTRTFINRFRNKSAAAYAKISSRSAYFLSLMRWLGDSKVGSVAKFGLRNYYAGDMWMLNVLSNFGKQAASATGFVYAGLHAVKHLEMPGASPIASDVLTKIHGSILLFDYFKEFNNLEHVRDLLHVMEKSAIVTLKA